LHKSTHAALYVQRIIGVVMLNCVFHALLDMAHCPTGQATLPLITAMQPCKQQNTRPGKAVRRVFKKQVKVGDYPTTRYRACGAGLAVIDGSIFGKTPPSSAPVYSVKSLLWASVSFIAIMRALSKKRRPRFSRT